METLKKFWHWADNELPCRGYEGRDLFDKKATAGGPLSEEAQEAMQQAIEIVGLRAPDVLHPSGEVLRSAIKLLSFAILEAWQLLANDERIQEAMREQAAKQAEHDEKMLKSIEIKVYAGKVNDMIISGHSWVPVDHDGKAMKVGDTVVRHPISDDRKRDKNVELAKHYGMGPKKLSELIAESHRATISELERMDRSASVHWAGDTVDLKPVTVIPVIGEMGVTRSTEHDNYRLRLLSMLGESDSEHLSIRVDSRGILFQSKEFNEIGLLCGFDEFVTSPGNGDIDRIDAHKLYLITNTIRHDVIKRKMKVPAVRAFPDAQNMFTGEPKVDYAKCERECDRILNLLGASDVSVIVNKADGRVTFYHRIHTGITYTLNYAPTVSSKSVEAAVSTVRKGALAQERQTNGFAVRLTGDWDKGNVG